MAYNRFYTEFEDAQGWQYTLYVLPSNANTGLSSSSLASLSSFTLVKLPDEFLMRDLKLETELGEIPAGLVSQVMTLNCNIASLQGVSNLDDLRECLLRGTTQQAFPYFSNGNPNTLYTFYRFNTFILMCNDGTGAKPIFIGCQKFSAENELTVTKLDNVLEFKIECFDVMRFICEGLGGEGYLANYLAVGNNATALDYGNGYTIARNIRYSKMQTGTAYYESDYAEFSQESEDRMIDKFNFVLNTFTNLKAQMDAMLTEFMRSITWNASSSISVPIPFAKAWTFHPPRLKQGDNISGTIQKPSFVSEIYKDDNGIVELKGGAIIDPNAFGKFKNFYDLFLGIVENTLEIYRLQYAWSVVSGWFSVSYTSDYLRASEGSGITFAKANIYSDVKMKFLQETLKNAKTSVSTLQGEKDNKVFPYAEGSSSDNGKDIELIFHNLPSPSGRVETTEFGSNGLLWRRNAINAGIIAWNDSGNVKRVDSQCQFKYSNTDAISLDYTKLQADNVNVQQILEQRESGVPYTIAYALVKSLGDSKQVDVEFDSLHEIVDYSDVGKNCTVNLNDLNPLLVKIYNANTGTGVITKHSLDVYSGVCSIAVRMHG